MPELTISLTDERERIVFSLDGDMPPIKSLLESAGIGLPGECGGAGKCGLCLIQVEHGHVSEPTRIEQELLSKSELMHGIRLGCQARALGDLSVKPLSDTPDLIWRALETNRFASSGRLGESKSGYGIAVDLGTTQIRMSLWNLDRGERVDGVVTLNPQRRFGADVLTRLSAAVESDHNAEVLKHLARYTVEQGIKYFSQRFGLISQQISGINIVGNTAMLTLISGSHYERLLQPEQWHAFIDVELADIQRWKQGMGLGQKAIIKPVEPLAGFVGSDLLAGVIATGLCDSSRISLLIDFGTNSEIALWDGEQLWVTSVPGGPAFEGSGLSHGMPALEGAISNFDLNGEGRFKADVIGGGIPKGICGSALVDAIALLLKRGEVNALGRFTADSKSKPCLLDETGEITVNHRDIDLFQRAKAATAAGIGYLLQQAGLSVDYIERLSVGGAFGEYLNRQHAMDVGLIPVMESGNVELCGDTALMGCEQLMVIPERNRLLKQVSVNSRIINLSMAPEFEMLFVENLYLKPIRFESATIMQPCHTESIIE